MDSIMSSNPPMDQVAKVEAALYAAGKPLSIEDLSRLCGIPSKRRVYDLVSDLRKRVKENFVAIEVAEYPEGKFVIQLKPSYSAVAKRFASRPLLSTPLLKTLSFVAFFQPITSAELSLRRGSSIYQHLRVLKEMGFVIGEKFGRTRLYRTTTQFSEYFGLNSDSQVLKKQLAEIGGIGEAVAITTASKS